MRDMVSCFSDSSVNVSNSSYSCKTYSKNACISPASVPSVQNAVVCVYRIILSSESHRLVTVTWCRSHAGHGLSVDFGSDPFSSLRLTTTSRLFRKKKGSKLMESDGSKVEAFWDLSTARFDSGPEPVDGFYVLIMVDSEIGLHLGDVSAGRKVPAGAPAARAHLISRQEHYSGNAVYSTKAQFCESGIAHELVIRFGDGDGGGLKSPMLSVSIDGKVVIRVKRLQWNFRGNETIFVDGLLVDLMWDVHKWFFDPVSGSDGVFMFRTRSGVDSRLWLEEKLLHKDEDRLDFSLFIYASRIRNS